MGGSLNAEFPVYVLKKLRSREAGVEDQGRPVMLRVKLAEERTQNRCFPRPYFASETDESHTMMNAVKKMCKGFLMRFAQEDKAGVRGQVKRLFTKAMEVEVHQEIPLLLSYDKKEGE
jgi:hypothetical protein